jgi:cytochrome c-type biogenesis protein CcmH
LKLFRRVLIAILLVSALALGSDQDRFKDLGEQFMCTCSCNQMLTGCTMTGCPTSGPMRDELKAKIASGMTDKAIRASFVEKFGAVVLSAPTTSGINITAWIMPFAMLGAGMLAVVFIVRKWRTTTPDGTTSDSVDSKDQSRVEEELKKYTPED